VDTEKSRNNQSPLEDKAVELPPAESNLTRNLISELGRRRVLQVAVLYAAIAWSITEAASFLLDALPFFPAWSNTLVAILFVVGFPVAMFLAWQFDIGPDGVQRTQSKTARGRLIVVGALVLLVGTTAGLFYLIYPTLETELMEVDSVSAYLPEPNTVVLLPFVNTSQDPDDLYLSEGLWSELFDQLGYVKGLKPAPRSSSFAFRNLPMDARAIARQLGVKWLIEATVKRQGDRLRVSVQIVDGVSGFPEQAAGRGVDAQVDRGHGAIRAKA